jgi:hypothetical protein
MARTKHTPGTVLELSLGDGTFAYGLVVGELEVAFFDLHAKAAIADVDAIVARPVLFVLTVYKNVFTTGRWRAIGRVDLDAHVVRIPDKFMQDLGDPRKCKIVDADFNTRPATPDECVGLERVAVWAGEHIEDRLRDHFAGRPNPHVEHMKVKR